MRSLLAGRILRAARAIAGAVAIPLLRARARRRIGRLRPGAATIVTVNWNSWAHLEVLIDLVRRRSPAGTEIIVVDNGSARARSRRPRGVPGLRFALLPLNLGHDLALDLGVLLAETEFAVTLDVDAFPLHDRWLDELEDALRAGAEVAGARLNREYVHPCCLAMRTARFVTEGHSFRANYRPRSGQEDASGDVGEEISLREAPKVRFFDVTSQRGPGDVGTVFGDLVYHNFYATRFSGIGEGRLDGVVAADDPARAWDEALALYAEDD